MQLTKIFTVALLAMTVSAKPHCDTAIKELRHVKNNFEYIAHGLSGQEAELAGKYIQNFDRAFEDIKTDCYNMQQLA
ncbi:hypothetical protein FQN54_002274 [Arachnomyces sp. PD_36]|nr:hypothetical protein FQN54_002274 [Arachnomyces sp. PD_36]